MCERSRDLISGDLQRLAQVLDQALSLRTKGVGQTSVEIISPNPGRTNLLLVVPSAGAEPERTARRTGDCLGGAEPLERDGDCLPSLEGGERPRLPGFKDAGPGITAGHAGDCLGRDTEPLEPDGDCLPSLEGDERSSLASCAPGPPSAGARVPRRSRRRSGAVSFEPGAVGARERTNSFDAELLHPATSRVGLITRRGLSGPVLARAPRLHAHTRAQAERSTTSPSSAEPSAALQLAPMPAWSRFC